jgi:tol-pal system protein YbgF
MSIKRIAWAGLSALYFFVGCTAAQPDQTINRLMMERSLADARKQMEEIQYRLSVIQFMVDSHEKAILDFKRSEKNNQQEAPPVPDRFEPAVESPFTETSVDDAYNQAFAAMKSMQYAEAAAQFSAVARNHPAHDLADNSLYWAGECFYADKKYNEAISAFNQVVERYPTQSKASDALLKIGFACIAIEDFEGAKHHLNRVIQEYPQSDAGIKARQKLAQIGNP